MRIAIISAIPEENQLLAAEMTGDVHRKKKGRRNYVRGHLWGVDTLLAISGIGKVAAAVTTTQILADFKPDLIFFTGVAGGVDPSLNIGDVVIANGLVQHDMHAVPLFKPLEIPMLGLTVIPPNEGLLTHTVAAVKEYLAHDIHLDISEETLKHFHITRPKEKVGIVASGDQFICNSQTTQKIRDKVQGVTCVEMEGAAIAQVCYEYQVPFSIIRVISDSANETAFVDFQSFIEKVASLFSRGILKRIYTQIHQTSNKEN